MEEKQKKSKAAKVIKGCLAAIGGITTVGCIVYVGNEVKKEFDATVDENNRLRDFINTHDFYEKQKSNFRVSNDSDNVSDDETKTEETKFNPNKPIYKQSASTMRKMGLNPDGTYRQKPQLVKIGEHITSDGYISEEWEDIVSGLVIYKPTGRKASEKDEKEA